MPEVSITGLSKLRWSQRQWPWIAGALLVLFTHLSTTFLTTLAQADWRECFDTYAVGVPRPHKYAVARHWALIDGYAEYYRWSIVFAVPAILGLVWLGSRLVALICAIMLIPLLWHNIQDFVLMTGEYNRGEVVTAQHGYHDCDRKGTDFAQVMRLWLYLTAVIVAAVIPAVLLRRWWLRRAGRPGQGASAGVQ